MQKCRALEGFSLPNEQPSFLHGDLMIEGESQDTTFVFTPDVRLEESRILLYISPDFFESKAMIGHFLAEGERVYQQAVEDYRSV